MEADSGVIVADHSGEEGLISDRSKRKKLGTFPVLSSFRSLPDKVLQQSPLLCLLADKDNN